MYTVEGLYDIFYVKGAGQCWHCGRMLVFENYGMPLWIRGAWEVDHSVPLSRGGTDYLRNLVPACISCNRSKGVLTSREFQSVDYGRRGGK